MKTFFDGIAHAFEAVGVHPVLGAFIAGAVIAYIFLRRGSSDASGPAASVIGNAVQRSGVSVKTNVVRTEKFSLTVDGRTLEFPAEVMTHIRAGDKIEAIKVLRAATGVDLAKAKQIVDTLASSTIAR